MREKREETEEEARVTHHSPTAPNPAKPKTTLIPRISPGLPEYMSTPPPHPEADEVMAIRENTATRIESPHLDCDVVRIGGILVHYKICTVVIVSIT